MRGRPDPELAGCRRVSDALQFSTGGGNHGPALAINQTRALGTDDGEQLVVREIRSRRVI